MAQLSHWPAVTEPVRPLDTVGDLLRRNAATWPDRPAILVPRGEDIETVTYSRLLARAERLARWLAERCAPETRIALWTRNELEAVILQHASALAGTILVPFNTRWKEAEVQHALDLVTPALAFAGVDEGGGDLFARLASLAVFPVHPLAGIDTLISDDPDHQLPDVCQDDPYLIQFTSGTTGRAKGALLSQRAALIGGWLRPTLDGAGSDDVWLNAVPYHHVGGSCAIVLGALTTGAAFVVLQRFDAGQMRDLMHRLSPTRSGGVPTMWHDLINQGGLPAQNRIKVVTLGGAAVPTALILAVREKLGARCANGYGQSEFLSVTSTAPDDPPGLVSETIGRALPHTELKIVDRETGATLPRGTVGEICARGPAAMEGYWNDPAGTAATIDAEGYVHTGDLGDMDEAGYIRIRGRCRELIIRGGENIYPAEIEAALMAHEGVTMAAVVGVPHERLGQEVGAVIMGPERDSAILEAWLASQLASFKVPRHWRFVDAMPMTASGKVRKVELEGLFA